MKKIIAVFMLGMIACAFGADDLRVSVRYEKLKLTGAQPYPVVKIVATTDSITIKNIKGNKGNCVVHWVQLPAKLSYGKSIETSFTSASCPNLLEIEIDTDKGSYKFNVN
ncbi:MAG: hypothetical protein SPI08_07405 [Campylobacter sp.]|uniref:hypothetical protein n=1 Tax=Campylobacter sp. TaxID=205 RepID=UPI002A8297B0|nr:hypothetical protein [Campylobacter sp.]MCI7022916.1 hypothetical protein [Campylobacter sp.]MCI7447506.1 hypothetical protein [Campylobacter sp.]MDY4444773.1 hypothetical protein [Campylobacter sp.]MDY4450962.1 hypothetical protein [Campylobacter sp.]MDY6124342.1 hypothetical protein [Campylobacter sp.]